MTEFQENQTPLLINPQEDLIKSLAEHVGPIVNNYQQQQMAVQKLAIEKEAERNQQQLIILNQIDNRDKYFKAVIVGLCLIALIFIEKEGTLAIIGTILGLTFGNNAMTDFFKGVKGTSENPKVE